MTPSCSTVVLVHPSSPIHWEATVSSLVQLAVTEGVVQSPVIDLKYPVEASVSTYPDQLYEAEVFTGRRVPKPPPLPGRGAWRAGASLCCRYRTRALRAEARYWALGLPADALPVAGV